MSTGVISFPRKSIEARKDHTYCPKVTGLPRLLIQEAKTFIGVIIRLEPETII
jgi:hypothetical protein